MLQLLAYEMGAILKCRYGLERFSEVSVHRNGTSYR